MHLTGMVMNLLLWTLGGLMVLQFTAESYAIKDSQHDDEGIEIASGCHEADTGIRHVVYPKLYAMSQRKQRIRDKGIAANDTKRLLLVKLPSRSLYVEFTPNEDLNNFWVDIRDETKVIRKLYKNCHYRGTILYPPGGTAVISKCSDNDTMVGSLFTPTKIYYIEPVPIESRPNVIKETLGGKDTVPHYLIEIDKEYGFPIEKDQHGSKNTGVKNSADDIDTDSSKASGRVDKFVGSSARLIWSPRKIMEVAVFADSDMYARFLESNKDDAENATVRRVLDIMERVRLVFSLKSLDVVYKLDIVKIEILKTNKSGPVRGVGGTGDYLSKFGEWQSKLNTPDGTPGHWDHAVMLSGWSNLPALGMAYGSRMCHSRLSVSASSSVWSRNPAMVVVHEIAHNLGASHEDKEGNCTDTLSVMNDAEPYWSRCSNEKINDFLRQGNGKCLQDEI